MPGLSGSSTLTTMTGGPHEPLAVLMSLRGPEGSMLDDTDCTCHRCRRLPVAGLTPLTQ